jgi:hypothetical protein
MADFSAEGQIRVDYVATIANKSAPDASSELNTATPLSSWIPPDGWAPAFSQNSVTTTSLASTFITSVPGTSGGPISLTFKRSNTPGTDTAWNLFKTGPSGYLVAREGQGGALGAWTAGDKVQVYPGKAHIGLPAQTAENTPRTFTVQWEPSEAPDLDATVAA